MTHPSERAAARIRSLENPTHADYKRIIDEEYAREEPHRVPCCNCGAPTTIDATYGDLCYRCIRADNE